MLYNMGAQNTHPQCSQRAISDLLKDNKYGSLMTSPGVPLCGTHALTGGTGVVRQTSIQDEDLWPEVHRSSHCVPEQCGSVATSTGCPARAGLVQQQPRRALERKLFLACWSQSVPVSMESMSLLRWTSRSAAGWKNVSSST